MRFRDSVVERRNCLVMRSGEICKGDVSGVFRYIFKVYIGFYFIFKDYLLNIYMKMMFF